jgi:diguanylate cyclase (GGDEF)-like protein
VDSVDSVDRGAIRIERKAGPEPRTGLGAPVWRYLAVLALLPSIGLAVVTTLAVRDRVVTASAADRVGNAATVLRQLDALRLAIESEAIASVAGDMLTALGTTAEEVNRAAATEVVVPLPRARRETDDALAAVRENATALGRGATAEGALAGGTVTAGRIGEIAQRLATDRLRADRLADQGTDQGTAGSPGSPGSSEVAGESRAAAAWAVAASFRSLVTGISGLERASADAIAAGEYGSGRYGAGGPDVLRAAAELRLVSRVALLGGERATAYRLLQLAPPAVVPGIAEDLRDADAAYREAAAELAGALTPPMSDRWRVVVTGLGTAALDRLVAGAVAGPPGASPALDAVLATAAATGAVTKDLALLQTHAADGLSSAAAAERSSAANRAVAVAGIAAGVLLLTGFLLLAVGGAVRRWLTDATAAAEEFDEDVRESASRLADAVHDRDRLRQELAYRSRHDALTGLANRTEGEEQIEDAVRRSRDEGTLIGLLFVDLGHFKAINETHGHHAGDHVLQVCAARMEAQVGGRGLVSRFGSDEFVVLLDSVESEFAAIDAGERIVATVGEPIGYGGHELFVTASVGVAVAEGGTVGGEELLDRSDRAVYRAKAAGRGGVVAR